MDSKEKTKNVGKSKETGFGFPSGDCQAMFEKMSTCCGDESNVIDCCSIRKFRIWGLVVDISDRHDNPLFLHDAGTYV
jgi:hypothetical protein